MLVKKLELPTFAIAVDGSLFEHLRQPALDAINNWDIELPPEATQGSHVSKLDYFVDGEEERPYMKYAAEVLEAAKLVIKNEYGWHDHNIEVSNVWMQQYKTNDFHSWHQHPDSTFNCVWYLEATHDTPGTILDIPGDGRREIRLKEGDLLIFPATFSHTSPVNTSGSTKTVIAFNI